MCSREKRPKDGDNFRSSQSFSTSSGGDSTFRSVTSSPLDKGEVEGVGVQKSSADKKDESDGQQRSDLPDDAENNGKTDEKPEVDIVFHEPENDGVESGEQNEDNKILSRVATLQQQQSSTLSLSLQEDSNDANNSTAKGCKPRKSRLFSFQ